MMFWSGRTQLVDWRNVMSSKQEITSSLNEIWGKLSARWTGDGAAAFHQQYIIKMAEVVEDFEMACSELSVGATSLSKKLQLIEQEIDNK